MFKFNRFLSLLLFLLYVNIYCQDNIIIDPLSGRSLYIEQVQDTIRLARASGFIIEKNNDKYLITNWHVVTGIDFFSGDTLDTLGRIPDKLIIYHHANILGNWNPKIEQLYSSTGEPRWYEHPEGRLVDVVALPLSSLDQNITIYIFDLKLANTDMIPEVAMPVSIIGYPVGFNGVGNFPIWKTGHIASEPNLNYEGKSVFLIDATTRGGMSGSPVILRLKGGYRTKSGNRIMSSANFRTLFLGVYSAQSPLAEIGMVWKPNVINEILGNISN